MSSWAASYENQLSAERAAAGQGGAGDAGNKTAAENNNNGGTFSRFGASASTGGGFGLTATNAFGVVTSGSGTTTTNNNTGFGATNSSSSGFGGATSGFGAQGFGHQTPRNGFGSQAQQPLSFGRQTQEGFGKVATKTAFGQQQAPNTGFGQQQAAQTAFGQQQAAQTAFGQEQAAQSAFVHQQAPNTAFGQQQAPQIAPTAFGQQQAAPTALGRQQPAQAAFGQQQAAAPTGFTQQAPSNVQRPQPVQFVSQHSPAVPDTSVLAHRRSPIQEAGEKPMNPEDVALLNKFLHRTVKMMTGSCVDVSRQQADPNSPLHSVLQFKELRLKDNLLRALDIMGYHQPSKIQEFALPLLLMEPPTNMIAQSQSGTGKTAAFVLTMLSRVVPENNWPQCVCLAPTYELAMQIGEVVNRMAKFMPQVKVHYAVKGTARLPHGFQLQEQILIGTPGRMIDYLTKMRCFNPGKIVCLVLDEADVMISQQGHLDLSHRIYNTIENASPGVQTMLFSATYDQAVMEFAEKLIKDAVSVTLKREDLALNNIKQFFVECRDRNAKYRAICDLYSGLIIASSVIFTRTRSAATWLAQMLKEKGHDVALLHGDMTVQERAAAIEAFKNGLFKVLITTNVCSRGIDVSQVTIVINYDLPYYVDRPDEPDNETYLHRIGRTGRFGKAGIAINFVDSIEDLYLVRKIENHFGKPIPKLDPSNLDELEAIEKEF